MMRKTAQGITTARIGIQPFDGINRANYTVDLFILLLQRRSRCVFDGYAWVQHLYQIHLWGHDGE